MHGTVVCAPDGSAVYSPGGEVALDQFSYHVVSADGEQATGSVTLVAGAPTPETWPVPAAGDVGDDGVPSKIVPRVPVEGEHPARDGIFAPLIGTLDRAGVR